MNKIWKTHNIKNVILAVAILVLLTDVIALSRKKYSYVGAGACKKCHASAIGNVYNLWSVSPHAKAFQNLASDRAAEISRKAGVEYPSKDIRCLSCHNTGGGKEPGIIGEGVGCEACHGAGSGYYGYSVHAAQATRYDNYMEAKKFGMYPVLGDDDIKKREKLCRHCHNQQRACYEVHTMEEKKRKELPLAVIADFRHEIR